GERIAIVEVVEVALVLAWRTGDVEAGFCTGSRKRDVSPLLEARLARTEDEGALDSKTLSSVAGQRICVADVPGLEIALGDFNDWTSIGRDRERYPAGIDGPYRSTGPVLHAEAIRVAKADDTVADGELPLGDSEAILPELA